LGAALLRVFLPTSCQVLRWCCIFLRFLGGPLQGQQRRGCAWIETQVRRKELLFGSDLFQASVLRKIPAARMANRCS